MTSWLRLVDFPLFVSHRRFTRLKRLPVARADWALDSGGFTELSMFGEWRTSSADYVAAVRRYRDEVGRLAWASPQDWMCEPFMIAKTGLSVAEHQRRTVENYVRLRDMAPDLPFVPVLQGWTLDDYLACVEQYERAGVDLLAEHTVGVGSVCRRQHAADVAAIISELHSRGLRLHGFGVKTRGLRSYAPLLASADSMAWSFRGRHEPGCTPNHKTESNCMTFARAWRENVMRAEGIAS
jgi:hypothetical protein